MQCLRDVFVVWGYWSSLITILILLPIATSYTDNNCQENWVKLENGERLHHKVLSCYKFVRSPKKTHAGAKEYCQTYHAELMTIDAQDVYEHIFMKNYLNEHDPLRANWLIGFTMVSPRIWRADNGASLPEVLLADFLSHQTFTADKSSLAYSYSYRSNDWGFLMTHGDEPSEFICEISSEELSAVPLDAGDILSHRYGMQVKDPKFLPRGPKIFKQPRDTVFDTLKRDVVSQVSITCIASSYPFPTYEWYKENKYILLNATKIEPFSDSRITVSGGSLVITNPDELQDRGSYFCKASNVYGSVLSTMATLSFAIIGEFTLQKSDESGIQYWGKAVYCDPPRYFPDVRFYWSRDFFPNFVEEDKRTLVSHDGNLYFSYLDNIDQGLYSCTVQSSVSDIGRHGPFFRLAVSPSSNYQMLTFANNFPKIFPDSPMRGDEVRLECIAFGYPVASYSWSRRNGVVPKKAILKNHNMVLEIPRVELSDTGDYVCYAQNTKVMVEGTITLAIQMIPSFTIPLRDKFISAGDDVTMECEAFAIPDVEYFWLKNFLPLLSSPVSSLVQGKYFIKNNILKIRNVTREDEGMYQCHATNQLGSTFSAAELKILAVAPSFTKEDQEQDFYAFETMSITIPCRPEAAPRPNFYWMKDNHFINGSGDHRRSVLWTGDLQIYPVDISDSGQYTCTAMNKYHTSASIMNLKIFGRPPKQYREEEKEVVVGEDLTLECNVYMDDLLEMVYVWRINGLRIHLEEEEEEIDGHFDSHYDFDYLDISFSAHETNQLPRDYVRIREPPYLRGSNPGDLYIQSVTLDDAGYYDCEAKTSIASFVYSTEVRVWGPPGPVGGVMALEITSTTAKLRWTNGHSNGYNIESYKVRGQMLISKEWIYRFEIDVSAYNTSRRDMIECQLPLKTLTPYSTYRFEVTASNALGSGPFSPPSPLINTKPDVPFEAPKNVSGGGGKIGDLTITWEPLPPELQNAPGVYYIVFWRRHIPSEGSYVTGDYSKANLRHRGNTGIFVTTIQHQYFYTHYEVRVQSANILGLGPVGNPVLIYSAENMPQVQPSEVKAFAFNSTALNVTWKAIAHTRENIRGKLIGYRLKYWRDGKDEMEAKIRLNIGTENHGLVVGLIPDTFYWVRVLAYNSAGSGPESEKFRERTWRYPPLTPPNAVQVSPVDPETVFVKWRGINPSAVEEPLLGYKVRVWKDTEDMTTANDTPVYLGSPLECLVTGLELGTIYTLRVLGFSLGGDGKMSNPPVRFSMGDPEKLRFSGSNHLRLSNMAPFIMSAAAILNRFKCFDY